MNFMKTFSALAFLTVLIFNESFAQEEYTQEASVYAIGRYGKKMANGDYLSSRHRTCSHEFLPVGSLIEVINLVNKRVEVIEVNGKSQTTGVELTHSVAHDLGLLGSNKANVKVLVVRRAEENITVHSVAERPSRNMTYGSQTAYSSLPVFTNPEPEKTEKKKTYEFPMNFPQHEPIKFDSTSKKMLINGKPIVPAKERPAYTEKIIMN